MRKLYVLLLLLTVALMLPLFTSRLFAAPLNGETIYNVKQPDGSSVPVCYFGDEFFATAESPDGYTLVHNSEGWLTYATLNSDKSEYLPSDVIYRGVASRGVGEKHLRITPNAIREKVEAGRKALNMPTIAEEQEAFWNRKPRPVSRNTVDTIIGLTILIDFPDQKSSVSKEQIEDYLNKEGYNEFSNSHSVRDYFYENSNGKLVYLNSVTEFYTAKNNKSYYDNPSTKANETAIPLIKEAMEDLKSRGFDFSEITLKTGKPYFTAVNVLYAGTPDQGWSKGLWPHRYFISDNINTSAGDLRMYQITNIGSRLSLGTFCHENGHLICNFPDLYASAGGAGSSGYDIMAGITNKYSPQAFNPFHRLSMGWVDTADIATLTQGNKYQIDANSNTAYIQNSSDKEAYMIENIGSTKQLHKNKMGSQKGLLIWRKKASQDIQVVKAIPGSSTSNSSYWNSSTQSTFNDSTIPSAKWSDGSASGVDIRNISETGDIMTFSIGELSTSTNVAPTDITLSSSLIDDTSSVGTIVGTLTTTDPDTGDAHTYSIIAGSNEFVLDRSYALKTKVRLTAGDYSVTIKTTDLEGLSFEKAFTITVNEVISDTNFINILSDADWYIVSDSTWSSGTLTLDSSSDTTVGVHATLTRGKKPADDWPYVSLNGSLESSLDSVYTIAITYKASDSVKFLLPMTGATDLDGSAHYVTLPATEGEIPKTETKIIADYQQPSWVTSKTELALERVNSLSFELASEDTTEVSGSISISALYLYGYQSGKTSLASTSQQKIRSLGVMGVTNKGVSLAIPAAGRYHIALYSVEGRLVKECNQNLTAGVKQISWRDNSLGNGVLILKVTGAEHTITTKALLK